MSIAMGCVCTYQHNAKPTLNRQVKWYNEHYGGTYLYDMY